MPPSATPDSPADPDLPEPDDLEDAERRTTLEMIKRLTGVESKVMLPEDDDSAALINTASDEMKGGPRRTGQYQLLGEIARGGVGVILKGRDIDLGRDIAMKVLKADHARRAGMIQRFVEEAQIGGQLQHPGIVPVYEMGVRDDGRPFFTMKLVKGRTLASLLLDRVDAGSERRRFLTVFEDICQTMAYAHTKGVVHRDLKPSNIMVGAFGEVLVVDWGLAKVLARGGTADENKVQTLQSQVSVVETIRSSPGSKGSDSITGSVLGTPAYMAPEQARGEVEKIDQRADVFSLGCILCEILTGEAVYQGSGEQLLLMAAGAHLDDAISRLDACDADSELIALTRSCLSPAVSARPKDAGELARTVHEHLESVEQRAQQARLAVAEERGRRRLTLLAAASVVLLLVVGVGGWLLMKEKRDQRTKENAGQITAAIKKADDLKGIGDLTSAHAELRQVEALLATEEVPLTVARQHSDLLEEVAAAIAERDLIERLDVVHLLEADAVGQTGEGEDGEDDSATWKLQDQAYGEVFRDLGLDLERMSVPEASIAIEQSRLPTRLCLALDDWARVVRNHEGHESERAALFSDVAIAADSDGFRKNVRRAIQSRDGARLRDLARAEQVDRLPSDTIRFLASALDDVERYPERRVLLEQGRLAHPADFEICLQLGEEYLDGHPRFVEEAVRLLEVAHVLQPRSISGMLGLARARSAAGEPGASVRLLREAWALRPADERIRIALAEALELHGEILWMNHDLEPALEALAESSRLNHDHFEVRLSRLMVAREHGGEQRLLDEFLDAEIDFEESPIALRQLSTAMFILDGESDRTYAIHQDILKREINAPELLTELGAQYWKIRWSDAARELWLRALELDESHYYTHAWLGYSALGLGRHDESERHFLRSIELRPEFVNTTCHLADLYVRQGRTEEARELVEKRLENDKAAADARRFGSSLRRLTRTAYDLSVLALETGIRNHPDLPSLRLELARTLHQMGDSEAALVQLSKVLERWPEDLDALELRWTCLEELGQSEQGIREARALLERYPHWPRLRKLLAVGLWTAGRSVEAQVDAIRAEVLDPYQADHQHTLGLSLVTNGDLEGALAAQRAAICLNSAATGHRGNHANSLREADRHDEAIPEIRELIRLGDEQAKSDLAMALILGERSGQDPASRDEALSLAESRFRDNRRSSYNNLAVGTVYLQLGRADEAVTRLEAALELPDRLLPLEVQTIRLLLAQALYHDGQIPEARRAYEQATSWLDRNFSYPFHDRLRQEAEELLGD